MLITKKGIRIVEGIVRNSNNSTSYCDDDFYSDPYKFNELTAAASDVKGYAVKIQVTKVDWALQANCGRGFLMEMLRSDNMEYFR